MDIYFELISEISFFFLKKNDMPLLVNGGANAGGKIQGTIDHHLIWYLENQEVALNYFSRQVWGP